MASPPVSTSASSIYDVTLDAPASPAPGVDFLGLGKPYMPSPRDVARNGLHPMRYAFAQAFGERGADSSPVVSVQEADMISAVTFNHRCDMIATGDRGGRIVILRRIKPPTTGKRMRQPKQGFVRIGDRTDAYGSAADSDGRDPDDDDPDDDDDQEAATDDELVSVTVEPPEFRFWTQFQSHEPEFDYLKSMEIEEKINQIRWCREVSGAQRLIATNDKTIKLWRVSERDVKTLATMDPISLLQPRAKPVTSASSRPSSSTSPVRNPAFASRNHNRPSTPPATMALRRDGVDPASAKHYSRDAYQLSIPKLELRGRVISASARREYSNAHAYHINSISLNSDEETFLSADDLRVNLWNLNRGGNGFNVLDMKPDNMEDLTEVITSAEFHPKHCHLFMHSSSRGVVKLCDLRMSALCESWARQFEEPEDSSGRTSFFSEIIASISDIKFSPDGRYILTRDYMSLRLWDVNMERAPVLVVPVHEYLRSRLCDLYENDCIFDKFQCAFSSDGGSLLTGSYNSLFQSYSAYDGTGAAVEASVDFVSGLSGRHRFTPEGLSASLIAGSSAAELVDPSRRILHLDAAPGEQIAAVASGPALYLYYGLPQ
eukprot:GFKZ01004389.1.p1 GENE.GFKZ01004389.1~~GFKZ01004389.1.p1  ORF type:complete len:636 (+),score=70.71 GFKZ01004389.1:100-1908(+)